jgi:DNA polymerase-3 subunit alpha
LEVAAISKKQAVTIGGVVTALKLKNTKKGDRYASFTLEDWTSSIEALVWPDTYKQVAAIIVSADPMLIQARAEVNDERVTLVVEGMQSLLEVRTKKASSATLSIEQYEDLAEKIVRLSEILGKYPGSIPLKARIDTQHQSLSVQLRDGDARPICIEPSEELCDRVEELFGRPVLSFA